MLKELLVGISVNVGDGIIEVSVCTYRVMSHQHIVCVSRLQLSQITIYIYICIIHYLDTKSKINLEMCFVPNQRLLVLSLMEIHR